MVRRIIKQVGSINWWAAVARSTLLLLQYTRDTLSRMNKTFECIVRKMYFSSWGTVFTSDSTGTFSGDYVSFFNTVRGSVSHFQTMFSFNTNQHGD